MWLRFSIIGLVLVLAACGFQPMYGENSAFNGNNPLAGNLIIETSPSREGQMLHMALEDKLNPRSIKGANPEYRLKTTLSKASIPAVVKSDGTIQRYDVLLTSSFELFKITENNKKIWSGSVHRTGSYNVASNANFATYEAEQDAIRRTIDELAEEYVMRLTGHFAATAK